MRLRNSRLRTKVAALLVSLTALWAFAAWVTLREGANLLWVATLNSSVADTSDSLLLELQRERRLSLIQLGEGGTGGKEALRTQRAKTDAAATVFVEQASSNSVALAASDTLDLRLQQVFRRIEGLKGARASVDAGKLDRVRAAAAYTEVVDSIYRAYDALASLDDEQLAKDARTLVEMSRAIEILAQEDALISGALAAGGLTGAERGQFAQLVGAQRFARAEAAGELPSADRRGYDALVGGAAFTRLRQLEDQLIHGITVPGPAQWKNAVDPVLAGLDQTVQKAGDGMIGRATPVAIGVVVRLALAGGLGLIAVIASIVLSVTTTRAILAQLKKLRDAAHELSDERLPRVVARIGRGEDVDVAVEAPPLKFGDDEIGSVGQAFNTVQETAIRVAVEQAELRRSIRDILLSLARRTQGLVHRQLTVLDVMERRETEPEELRDLFRLDHLATRMRRNAENLIVLSGSSPGRTWRRSVPMIDVVRGALAEVEDYTRVQLLPMGEVTLAGKAVGDVIHLLAELIENAVSFSPPYTMVQVSGQVVANGYVFEIEDRGLGMTPEDLEAANRRIAEPPEFRLTGTARLGLYVVARLAERHEIQVQLKASPYGGTTVVVLIPYELVGADAEPEQDEDDTPGIPAPRTAFGGAPTGAATALRPVPVIEQPVRPVAEGQGGVPVDAAEIGDGLLGDGPVGDTPVAGAAKPPLPTRRPADAAPQGRPAPNGSPSAEPRSPVAEAAGTRVPGAALASVRAQADQTAQARDTGQETATASEQGERATPAFTPSGLPFRVPQTNLAPALKTEDAAQAQQQDEDERSPEEIRAIMGSFQSGTRLGRTQAAKMTEGDV
ncbi:sensor histidine kinase [Nonomuraea africana]|uniref:histidine kinase n=1 Tax=Nonomuraea africana TaxID=46171 RepID=A0ABR9KFI0_9ACTN|nr:nitrate- and nitrite sensing domain-containing protein [Nonomuraea africana]MBE1560595.1 signal transduction histidine kinase [Nonomuraea africana]